MSDFILKRADASAPALRLTSGQNETVNLFLLLLLIGVLSGSIFGTYSMRNTVIDIPLFSMNSDPSEDFFPTIWCQGKYFLFFLIASSTYFGVLLSPALMLLRGYYLGSSAASMFAVSGYSGLLRAFLLFGVPAILTIPSLTLISNDSFQRARELILLSRGRRVISDRAYFFRRHLLAALILLLLDAVYCCCILPYLIA